MKKLIFTIFIALLLTFAISAQSIKTDDARRLKEVEKRISINEISLKYEKKRLANWSNDVYSISDREKIENEIKNLEKILLSLYEEKKQLLTKPMIRQLPNTQIELLKILILQNEKIIDLLEDKQK